MKTIKYLLLFIITIGIFAADSNLNITSPELNFVPVSEPKNSSDTFDENARVYIYNDGYSYSYYTLSGSSIQLSGVELDDIQDLFPEQYQRFSSANWYFYPDSGPLDQNVEINLYFNTGDITVARSDAQWIMGFINAFTVTDYVEDRILHSDTYSTGIQYRGHVNWPDLIDVYNESIPRDYGGLAETLDITNCSYFSFQISASGSSVYRSFNCHWPGTNVEYLEGSFTFDFKEYIHVSKLQQLNGDYYSHIMFSLPNVSNLVVNPSYADITYNDYNSWELNYRYDVSLTLTSTLVDDFIVSFDHTFVPWDLIPRENAYVYVNPYGYARKEINIYHENSDFINWTEHFPEIYTYSSSTYNLDNDDYAIDLSFKLRNLTGDNTELKCIIFQNWIETNMPGGWVQTSNSNWSSPWWNGTENIDAWRFNLRYNFTTMDKTNWDSLWNTTWIYEHSIMMQESDLKTVDSIQCYGSYTSNKGGYIYHYTNFVWNPLNRYETTLFKEFLPIDNPSHSISMVDLFEWSSFAKSDDFYSAHLYFNVPVKDLESYSMISPTEGDSEYSFGFWTNENDDKFELGAYLETFTTSAPVNDLAANFNYDFHPDKDDLISPGGYVSTGNPYVGPSAQINFTATDDGYYGWWDEGYLNGTPHFPSTGIASVDYELISNAFSGFQWDGSMTNYTDSEFGFTIDTTTMPDGSYLLISLVTDNSGNQGDAWDNIEIDNYDASYVKPPSIELISHNLSENDKVMGDEILTFNITDEDAEIFASLITIDGTGWLLEDASNPDPDLYDFNWTTELYNEGYHLVTVTSWDMDGNETTEYYDFEVDNRPIGNPPKIDIIDPSVPEQSIENWFTFRANVTDDFRISSVQGQIDNRVAEDMIYSEASGLYEYDYDVSTLFNGTHTFKVIVYDYDENQHMVESSIDFIAITTNYEDLNDPPRYQNLIPGNFEDASDIVTGDVEISIEVTDDLGIQGVQITISEVTGLDDITSYPSYPSSVDENDLDVVSGFPQSMDEGSIDGVWTTYTNLFDTTTTTDGLYLVEILIGDVDPFSHVITARFLMIIKNTMGDPFAQIPGFAIEYLVGCIGISILVGYMTIKRKLKSR